MKKIILITAFLISSFCKAQDCAIIVDPSNASRVDPCDYNLPNSEKYCINVFFHIVRDTGGANGFSPTQIPNIVTLLNQYFNPHNITIINLGFDYIDNTELNTVDATEYFTLTNLRNTPNAIDFFMVKQFYANGGAVNGSKKLVVQNSSALTIASCHELGHCLSLHHTFHGTQPTSLDPGGCYENINGTNCSTCGDLVCDTPSSLAPNADATNIYDLQCQFRSFHYWTRYKNA